MGAAARARVIERFDAKVTTAALIDVLHEARRRHRGDQASTVPAFVHSAALQETPS
jgi:hypothetical protein